MQNLDFSAPNNPILTVITVAAYETSRLERTCLSLLDANCRIEHLFVFPGMDNETDIYLQSYRKLTSFRVTLIRDQGKGIYPAMNIGLKAASGRFVLFLNAGDQIADISQFAKNVEDFASSAALWGILGCSLPWDEKYVTYLGMERDFLRQKIGGYVSHQSVVVDRRFLISLGGFNTSYKIAADTSLTMQLANTTPPKLFPGIAIKVESGRTVTASNRRSRFETLIAIIVQRNTVDKLIALLNFSRKELGFLFNKFRRELV
jgi:glycosyltransferase involved in cell wall biosynthesis